MPREHVAFSDLQGKTVVDISGMKSGNEEVYFTLNTGDRFRMYHEQECCEAVWLEDVAGNYQDLLDTPIVEASERSSDATKEGNYDSATWTFYHIRTAKGTVVLRWYGTSNGYYSESVDFVRVTDAA